MLDIAEKQTFDLRFAEIRSIQPESLLLSRRDRASRDIREVGLDGVISLNGRTYRVKRTATYKDVDDQWQPKPRAYVSTELSLFCLESGEALSLEWGVEDKLEISLTEHRLSPAELKKGMAYDDGEVVDVSDIEEIGEEEWEIVYSGETYYYSDIWSAKYETSDGKGSYVLLLELQNESRSRNLTIEAWSDTPKRENWEYDAYTSIPISPTSIEVLAV